MSDPVETGATVAAPRLAVLSGDLILCWWDAPRSAGRRRLRAGFGEGAPTLPLIHAALPLDDGERVVALVERPSGAASRLRITDPDGRLEAEADAGRGGLFDDAAAAALADGLSPGTATRLLRFLVESCSALFERRGCARFAAACARLVLALVPGPADLTPRAALTSRLFLAGASLPEALGVVERVLVIGPGVIEAPSPWRGAPAPGGPPPALFPLPAEAGAGALVLSFAAEGVACHRLSGGIAGLPCPAQWRETPPPPAREAILGWLAARADDPQARAAALELRLFRPLPAKALENGPVSAAIDLAISDPEGGLFVKGRLSDPAGLVERLEADGRRPLTLFAFSRDADGFAAYAPGPAGRGSPFQHRVEVVLRSGGRLELMAPPPPLDPVAARAAVLGAVPLSSVSGGMLVHCLAPALAAHHAAARAAGGGAPEWVSFGEFPARPAVSVIVPLYVNLDFVRFQVAAFALDPDFATAELVYVLDSPGDRDRLVRLLEDLNRVHGLPIRLAVMPANRGYAAANNAAVQGARGGRLLFLNSDVVPAADGWLGALVAALSDRVAAVGAKLLYEDDSLQHAGMIFAPTRDRRWENRHRWKGLPRRFTPALRAASVPAVTGACLLVRRDRFEAAGGFCEDYVIGDFEDSDLCLRLRRDGGDIVYEPAAELYHLERRSIARHPDHARGVATLYNEWLHTQRWDADITALMADFAEGRVA